MLDTKLRNYADTDTYPFHMPGHKRNMDGFENPYNIDITEITGFDDLHHADGIIKEAQQRAAKLYGADRCYYLVNGSTCGILSAISATTKKGDKIIVARNCHKSVYHALYLRELQPVYVYPEVSDYNIQGQIRKEDIQEILEQNTDIKAVIITSPTYDGVVSDIAEIAKLVHAYNIPLIVDEAHGAHFGLDESMPQNAINLGADCVIVSIHKTLPAFTQTALLLVNEGKADCQKIEESLDIYETSSPSYILMAGIEKCIRIMTENSKELFAVLNQNLDGFYKKMQALQKLHVLIEEDFKDKAFEFDRTKILISTENTDITGHQLKEILTDRYQIELEMSCENYALAIATVMDEEDGFRRLAEALIEIDSNCNIQKTSCSIREIYTKPERKYEIHQTDNFFKEKAYLQQAEGKISSEYIYFYPPGIPILVPGERINSQNIKAIEEAIAQGIEVYGLTENKMIFILKE